MAPEDDIIELNPSDSSSLDETLTNDDVGSPDVDAGGDPADSSPANGEKATDVLSIVRDVVSKNGEPDAAASPAAGGEQGQKPGDPAAKEPDDVNYSDVPFHKHPRFQQLLRKAKTNEADAERYQNVQNFLDQNGISAQEAADGFVVMGLLKTNPVEAWTRLKPIVQNLLVAVGEVLPDDLQQRVTAGELSQQAALELSRSRAQLDTLQRGRTFEEQRSQQRQTQELDRSLRTTASDWQADRERKDPNFAAKLPALMKELAYMQLQEGKPNTPQGVQDQLNRAYKAIVPPVAAPPKRSLPNARPAMSGQVSGGVQPKPKSTMDIIQQVVSQRGS